ncbi:MAG: carbamoyltransferase C-terminal domain-containing protein [Candidatus Omnitrophota bacterium]|jgi:carbamoyltransferase
MILLSLCDNHDSGACILKDGELLFAVNEERLSRKKLQGGFPRLSIEECLRQTGSEPSAIDAVVFASRMTPTAALRLLFSWHDSLRHKSSSFSYFLNIYIIYQVIFHFLKFPEFIDGFFSGKIIASRMERFGIHAPVYCIGHHEAHAATAYYSGNSDEKTLVITLDAMGDGVSVTINIGCGNSIERVYEQSGFSAISTYYQRLTEFLGFAPLRHEGKITSLAAYGRFNEKILALAQSNLRFSEKIEGFEYKNYLLPESSHSPPYKQLRDYSREDIAFNFQKNFEDEITKFITWWVVKLKIYRIALAGGIFANVSLNQRIKDIEGVQSVYIFPHMGDGGLAVGAALAYAKPKPFYLKHIYLGPQYDDASIKSLLERKGTVYALLGEELLCEKIADLLAQGKTVGHFNGRMEFGPRALGNRSILYRADDTTVMGWLNEKMDRSSFMPFAPVSLDHETGSLYQGIDAIRCALRFMTLAVDCTGKMKRVCPSGVHLDGTARPQLLLKEDNPRLYRILEHYQKKKGIATILNTSFNRHEEPIVCSPEDALKSFRECELDVLVLNNFLIFR